MSEGLDFFVEAQVEGNFICGWTSCTTADLLSAMLSGRWAFRLHNGKILYDGMSFSGLKVRSRAEYAADQYKEYMRGHGGMLDDWTWEFLTEGQRTKASKLFHRIREIREDGEIWNFPDMRIVRAAALIRDEADE